MSQITIAIPEGKRTQLIQQLLRWNTAARKSKEQVTYVTLGDEKPSLPSPVDSESGMSSSQKRKARKVRARARRSQKVDSDVPTATNVHKDASVEVVSWKQINARKLQLAAEKLTLQESRMRQQQPRSTDDSSLDEQSIREEALIVRKRNTFLQRVSSLMRAFPSLPRKEISDLVKIVEQPTGYTVSCYDKLVGLVDPRVKNQFESHSDQDHLARAEAISRAQRLAARAMYSDTSAATSRPNLPLLVDKRSPSLVGKAFYRSGPTVTKVRFPTGKYGKPTFREVPDE